MRLGMALLAILPACGGDDMPSAPRHYGTVITLSFPASPSEPLMWTSNVDIDTDATGMCDQTNDHKDNYCVVAGKSISLASGVTLTAHGKKPLILLSTSTFDLQGTIDVSSKRDGSTGAGACLPSSPATFCSCANTTAATGNSGGFGGSFGGKGGNGGAVDGVMGTAAPALTAIPTSMLHGGCPGGDGNSTTASMPPYGTGGSGGGAVLIIAEMLQINGTINASGAGGRGGSAAKSGGGGGGSGGMIVIDVGAESIVSGPGSNSIFANGGGGGQGGTGVDPASGPGDDGGESPDPMTAGTGGSNINRSGGHGGVSSFGVRNDGTKAGNATNSGGGGGGGGGAGLIRTPPIAGAVIAPLATPP